MLLALITACGDSPVYDNYKVVDSQGWHADSLMVFSFEVEDTLSDYAVYLKMRHNNAYPKKNIWFFRTISSKRGVEYTDTINYTLADDMGKWLGQGIGDKKHVTMPYKTQALRFNKLGTYDFTIQHGMRDTVLPGILEFGMEVYAKNIAESNGK